MTVKEPSPGPRRRFLGQIRDRVVASDPAFSRLRMATRAMLSLFITAALLGGFHFLVHALPIASYGLGVVISLTGSMMIRDSSSWGQFVSRSWAALAAIVSVLIASVLAPWPIAAYAMFLLVIFTAVYIRQFGMRWFGVGMIGFMAYFMGDYLHPQLADMGWVALAAVIAFAVTQLVTTVLLKDDPERDFRRALVTIDRRVNLVLRELREKASEGREAIIDRRPMRDHIARLREAVLMAEGFIPQGEGGSLAAEGAASDLAVALFDLQLAIERAVGASFAGLPPAAFIDAVLHWDGTAMTEWPGRRVSEATDGGATARLLLRVHRARERLGGVLGPAPSPAFAGAAEIAPPPPAGGSQPAEDKRVPLKLAVQVTVASALALGCGLLLSPVRWYWAVITAFIVFNNTRSRADTALRALQRSAGTLAGVIVGTIVATMLAGQMAVSTFGILLLFFTGFYFVQVSYSVMIFCITVALALLYGIMGMFTPQLLLLRLAETLVGGLAGTGVAFFLFPNRTTTNVEGALGKYLDAMEALLDAAQKKACGTNDGDDLLGLSRAVDRAYTELANAVRPMGAPWMAVTRFGAVREKLLLLTGCARWGRSLARSLSGGHPPDFETRKRIDDVVVEIRGRIAVARARGPALFEQRRHGRNESRGQRRPLPIREDDDPAFSLEVISGLMQRAIS